VFPREQGNANAEQNNANPKDLPPLQSRSQPEPLDDRAHWDRQAFYYEQCQPRTEFGQCLKIGDIPYADSDYTAQKKEWKGNASQPDAKRTRPQPKENRGQG
jgi:hypothetical protein